jgi:hypothetical protein
MVMGLVNRRQTVKITIEAMEEHDG